jgi:hypothetical protein
MAVTSETVAQPKAKTSKRESSPLTGIAGRFTKQELPVPLSDDRKSEFSRRYGKVDWSALTVEKIAHGSEDFCGIRSELIVVVANDGAWWSGHECGWGGASHYSPPFHVGPHDSRNEAISASAGACIASFELMKDRWSDVGLVKGEIAWLREQIEASNDTPIVSLPEGASVTLDAIREALPPLKMKKVKKTAIWKIPISHGATFIVEITTRQDDDGIWEARWRYLVREEATKNTFKIVTSGYQPIRSSDLGEAHSQDGIRLFSTENEAIAAAARVMARTVEARVEAEVKVVNFGATSTSVILREVKYLRELDDELSAAA